MNRKYTLERMFSSQLVESAKEELSFRTVVRDLRSKSPMLQIVLVNPNSWCCSGDCLDTESTMDSVSKLDLNPVIKVLFEDCRGNTQSQSRLACQLCSLCACYTFLVCQISFVCLSHFSSNSRILLDIYDVIYQNKQLNLGKVLLDYYTSENYFQ